MKISRLQQSPLLLRTQCSKTPLGAENITLVCRSYLLTQRTPVQYPWHQVGAGSVAMHSPCTSFHIQPGRVAHSAAVPLIISGIGAGQLTECSPTGGAGLTAKVHRYSVVSGPRLTGRKSAKRSPGCMASKNAWPFQRAPTSCRPSLGKTTSSSVAPGGIVLGAIGAAASE